MTPEFQAFIVELFSGFWPVEIRRLFNFHGLFHQGTIFGVVADGRIYLKCNDDTRMNYVAENSSPFRFRARDGSEIVTSYCELPPRLHDEPDEAAEWARAAFEGALRSPPAMRKARRKKAPRQPARRGRRK